MKSGENMDEKGKRFVNEEGAVSEAAAHESPETAVNDKADAKRIKKEQRLKEKNSKKLEKLLKKQQKRDKRSHREVLTYEDMPLEEREDEELDNPVRKKSYSKKRIITVSIIILLLFGIVFYAFNSDKLSVHNIANFFRYGVFNGQSDESFPLDIKGESISAGNFMRMGQDICYSSDTKTQLLNNYGRTIFSAQHAFINPVLTINKDGALIYNLGGTGYQLIDKEGESFMEEMKDDILVADYSDSGVYAIVTESGGYLSKLYVYNEKHEQIFAYSFADYYVTSVSVNSSGTKAVVSGISALNGINISALYVLDFTKDTPLYFFELENNFIYEVEYITDKYACAIGRSSSYSLNTYNGELAATEYEGKALTAYDINKDTKTFSLSLSGSGDGRNCDIVSFTAAGKEDKRFTVDERIIDISTFKGRVALLTNDSVLLYSKDGNSVSSKELKSDPHSVVLYTSSDAYILCTGYMDALSI